MALMGIRASHAPARLGPGGEPRAMKSPSPRCAILLEQSRAPWDQLLILLGLLVAERAKSLSSVVEQLGRLDEARAEFARAAAACSTPR